MISRSRLAVLALALLLPLGAFAAASTEADPKPTATVRYSGDTARIIVQVFPKCNPGCPTNYTYAYTTGGTGGTTTTHASLRTVDTLVVTPRVAVVGQTKITPFKGTVLGNAVTVTWSITAYVPPPIIDSAKVRIDTSGTVQFSFYTLKTWSVGDSARFVQGAQRPWTEVAHVPGDTVSVSIVEGDSLKIVARLRLGDGSVRPVWGRFAFSPPIDALLRTRITGAMADTMYWIPLPCVGCTKPPGSIDAEPTLRRLRNGQFAYFWPTLIGWQRADVGGQQ